MPLRLVFHRTTFSSINEALCSAFFAKVAIIPASRTDPGYVSSIISLLSSSNPSITSPFVLSSVTHKLPQAY